MASSDEHYVMAWRDLDLLLNGVACMMLKAGKLSQEDNAWALQ